jgi:hypothetical protein
MSKMRIHEPSVEDPDSSEYGSESSISSDSGSGSNPDPGFLMTKNLEKTASEIF